MKRVLLLALMITCIASLAWADDVGPAGTLGVFSDLAGTACQVTDPLYANFYLYVLHYSATAANSSQFRIDVDPTLGAASFNPSVAPGLLSLGNFTDGITITYVGCKTTFPLHIATIQWFGLGNSTECHWVRIAADPGSQTGKPEVVDCGLNKFGLDYTLTGYIANDGVDCSCSVSTQETSWSKIKSLYK